MDQKLVQKYLTLLFFLWLILAVLAFYINHQIFGFLRFILDLLSSEYSLFIFGFLLPFLTTFIISLPLSLILRKRISTINSLILAFFLTLLILLISTSFIFQSPIFPQCKCLYDLEPPPYSTQQYLTLNIACTRSLFPMIIYLDHTINFGTKYYLGTFLIDSFHPMVSYHIVPVKNEIEDLGIKIEIKDMFSNKICSQTITKELLTT